VKNAATRISGVTRRAATLVNGGILTSARLCPRSPSMARNAQMRASREAKSTSGATARSTAVGVIARQIPSIKKGSVSLETPTMRYLETVRDMYPAAMVAQFSSNVNQLSTLTTSSSRVHSRRTRGVLGSLMNCKAIYNNMYH